MTLQRKDLRYGSSLWGAWSKKLYNVQGTSAESWAYFLSKNRILSRDDALGMVTGDSLMFMGKMPPMPVPVAKQLLHIDKGVLRKDVRSLKFRRKTKRRK